MSFTITPCIHRVENGHVYLATKCTLKKQTTLVDLQYFLALLQDDTERHMDYAEDSTEQMYL